MKVALNNFIPCLAIIGFVFALIIDILSIINLSRNYLPTLSVLMFEYAFFFLTGILYFLKSNRPERIAQSSSSKNVIHDKILGILFFLIIVIVLYTLNFAVYIKPPSYYFLLSLASAAIGLQIIFGNETNNPRNMSILFLQIILLAIIIRLSSYIINPYLIGPDTIWHFRAIQELIITGYRVPWAYHYYYFPFYHLSQAISEICIGVSKDSFNLINLSISIVCIIIAYSISKNIFNSGKAGLLGSLLIAVSTYPIFLVTYNTSKIGGAALFLICLLLIIRNFRYNDHRNRILFWLSAVAAFFWHPEVFMAIAALVGGEFIIRLLLKRELKAFLAIAITSVAFLLYLKLFHTYLLADLIQGLLNRAAPMLIQNFGTHSVSEGFLIESLLAYLSISLPAFSFAYLGLTWLKVLNKIGVFIICTCILLHVIPLFSIVTGSFGLNPERLLTYISIILLLITAGVILEFFESKKRIHLAVALFIFAFFSLSSYIIGDGNDILNDKIPHDSTRATMSTLCTYDFLAKSQEGSIIVTDKDTMRYIGNPFPPGGLFSLPNNQRMALLPSYLSEGYILINKPNLGRDNWKENFWITDFNDLSKSSNLMYNNENILIYKRIV